MASAFQSELASAWEKAKGLGSVRGPLVNLLNMLAARAEMPNDSRPSLKGKGTPAMLRFLYRVAEVVMNWLAERLETAVGMDMARGGLRRNS
jgi:hypothetical protein